MSDLRLLINGKKYGGWKRIAVTRSLASLSGSFSLDISDRWEAQPVPWPIQIEDQARIEIDGDAILDGFVDHRSAKISAQDRTLSFSGKDRAAALVECSADLRKWSFRNVNVIDLARKMAAPFDIKVSVQPGLDPGRVSLTKGTLLPKHPKLVVSPGDTAWSVVENAARLAGVLIISDGLGGILITRTGTEAAEALVVGKNCKEAGIDVDAADLFRTYRILVQAPTVDDNWSPSTVTRIKAQATDPGVRRANRVLVIRPDKGMTAAFARDYVTDAAGRRRARSGTVTCVVQGWRQSTGRLWDVNLLADVEAPAIGVSSKAAGAPMLISQVDFSLDTSGQVATIQLVDPRVFTPEPSAVVKQTAGLWPELAHGTATRGFAL